MATIPPRVGAALALTLLLSLAGCALPLAEGVAPEGRRVVLLLDASTSMRDNDPAQVAPLGAELVLGLAGSRDNVGVITYAAEATVRRPLGPAGGASERAALGPALRAVARNGITDFAAALEAAHAMLAASAAPPGAAVVLLTDGVPYRGRRQGSGGSLDAAIAALARRGWRLFAIALGEGADSPFLTRLVARTGGAVVAARDAGGLVAAFEEVAVEALGYLRAERAPGAGGVEVLPHTARLAFVCRGGTPSALVHDGTTQPPGAAVRTGAEVAVALVEQPAPGTWRVEGAPGEVVTLLEPRFALELAPGAPPERVLAGADLPVEVRLVGDPERVAEALPRLVVRAFLERAGERLGPVRTLRAARGGDQARLVGALRAPPAAEETGLRLVVEALLSEEGRRFVLRRTRALTVAPASDPPAHPPAAPASGPAPLALELPPRLVAARWEDEPPPPLALAVRGDPTRAVVLTCAGRRLALAPGARGELVLPASAGPLEVVAEGDDGARLVRAVSIERRTYRWVGPAGLTLPAAPAGAAVGPVPLPFRTEPGADLEAAAATLTGPGGALRVALGVGGLSARLEPGLTPGVYRGALALRVAREPSLPPRAVPLALEVLAPPAAPREVVVEGSWGWVSAPIEVAWPAAEPVAVEITPGRLTGEAGALEPEFDLRIEPLDGWSGERLGARPRRFALSLYCSSDLAAGTYTGRVEVRAAADSAPPLVIPVRLELRR